MAMTNKMVKDYVEKKYKVRFEKAEDLYQFLQKRGKYKLYFNQRQGQKTTLDKLSGNCADWNNDLVIPILRAMGYKVVIGHVTVTCNDNKQYGHWLLYISGKRWTDKIFDAVSATKTGRAFGVACCIHKPVKIIARGENLKIS